MQPPGEAGITITSEPRIMTGLVPDVSRVHYPVDYQQAADSVSSRCIRSNLPFDRRTRSNVTFMLQFRVLAVAHRRGSLIL